MLQYKIIPITGHDPHTHGIQIVEPGPYEGLVFVFGKIEFLGEDKSGQGRFMYDYMIVKTVETTLDNQKLELEISQILNHVLEESTVIADVEQREKEIAEEQARVAALPQDPVLEREDGSIVEFQELLPEED